MRASITGLFGGRSSNVAARPTFDSRPLEPDPSVETLQEVFLDRSAQVRSIVAVGCHGLSKNGARVDSPLTLQGLAQKANELQGPFFGHDLLLLPSVALNELMTPLADDFSFRAIAVLFPQAAGELNEGEALRVRRSLFDRGLVCIGSAAVADSKALCFLASDAVGSVNRLDVESRGYISFSNLERGARFANQLFRYACAKFYALRHGLTAAFPPWEGEHLFGLHDKSCEGLTLPKVHFNGFADDDRVFWEMDDPPIDIDLEGYFQEIPECWRRHRPLLRNMFQLPQELSDAIDAWRHSVTDAGERTLVAVHIRRGDYRGLQSKDAPWFRLVPEDWYLDWLRTVWPTLRRPLLFVATDEPEAILPVFSEFETISPTFGSIAEVLPDHVRDFEVLRRSDYLAICNSSFSRMAAILAPSAQKCFLPSFRTQSFEPYEPWIDPAFWKRFADAWRLTRLRGQRRVPSPAVSAAGSAPDLPAEPAATYFDVSDLLRYMLHHATLSGIQRVQCEVLHHLLGNPRSQPVRPVVLNERAGPAAIDNSGLLDIIEDFQSDTLSRPTVESKLRALLSRSAPVTVRRQDVFLTIGAFWAISGVGAFLQQLKTSGAVIGVFVHDIIPIVAPEYFEPREARVFVKAVNDALTFADFVLTASEYNKATLVEHMAVRKLDPLPVHVVPLGHAFSLSVPADSKVSDAVAAVVDTEYVLCVGTIEVRKNPAYLFNIWKMMVRSGRSNIPTLVFAGRRGWFVQDFLEQLKACNYLGGRIVLLHNVTDIELDLLYRKCLLTAYPSFVEGWGLPVGESLAHGKVCICSAMGGIPAAGGDLADYVDPYNAGDGLDRLLQYLDYPELRRGRERTITDRFEPRSWRNVADDFLRSTQALARQVPPFAGVAAIMLPPGGFVSIGNSIPMDGTLSGELACISGWAPPEASGVRAAHAEAMIRFRADAPVGTRINLVMRLAAVGRDFRIRIRSGSGAATESALASGSERLAVLSCEVEPEKLVTAHLSLAGRTLDEDDEFPDSSYWILKGILYFDSKRDAAQALNKPPGANGLQSAESASPPPRSAQTVLPDSAARPDRILIRRASMDDTQRASSFGEFLQSTDTWWPVNSTSDRAAPVFADRADRLAFYSGCGNIALAPQVGSINDGIRLIRRRNQFVSMSRFSEGSVFDRSGVWREYGYLQGSPPGNAPWMSNEADGLRADEAALAAAPYFDHSYLIFYNGNLHNYYHWMVEGLLTLDIMSRALGRDSNLRFALPKSMDINALFDHRESVRALGFGGDHVVEVAENLIQVREAIWVDSDLVQFIPATCLRDFQQRVSALYADVRALRNRRLLVARKGPTRTIQNLEQVQDFLSRYGFETVYLEGMSTRDQILMFQSAEFIVAPHGAGLANLLFCEPGTKVIELTPAAEMRPFFWVISEKLELVHGLQFCATVVGRDFQSSIVVDIRKLQALFRMVDAHF